MKEIIAFFVSGKEYGIEIVGMQSLESYRVPNPVEDVPEYILGTVEIRQEIYPIFDIHSKLGLPKSEMNETSKILLLHSHVGNLACIVDQIGKVFRVEGEDVQQFPAVARTSETSYIDFIAKRDNDLIVIIDPNKLLTKEQEEQLKKIDFSAERKEE